MKGVIDGLTWQEQRLVLLLHILDNSHVFVTKLLKVLLLPAVLTFFQHLLQLAGLSLVLLVSAPHRVLRFLHQQAQSPNLLSQFTNFSAFICCLLIVKTDHILPLVLPVVVLRPLARLGDSPRVLLLGHGAYSVAPSHEHAVRAGVVSVTHSVTEMSRYSPQSGFVWALAAATRSGSSLATNGRRQDTLARDPCGLDNFFFLDVGC